MCKWVYLLVVLWKNECAWTIIPFLC
jgi:hypothetical protein